MSLKQHEISWVLLHFHPSHQWDYINDSKCGEFNSLFGVNTGNGSPIPRQIANKLRGRTFGNFDQFRKAFWLEVSKDPELLKQFNPYNQTHVRNGNSPFTREADCVGGRERYEIHHIKPIRLGGDVYDVDNMGVTTPKRHVKIHSTRQGRSYE